MTFDQMLTLGLLAAAMVLFLWGRLRHDVVALLVLVSGVVVGVVPGSRAFEGFGHPAVITVAGVLILSRALQTSGAIDLLAARVLPTGGGTLAALGALLALGAGLSAFMNNVGALALLMPLTIRLAERQGVPPGRLLMPLSFATILGGMTTLVGTPPNLVVSGIRDEAGLGPFRLFDFAPVGVPVAAAGLVFLLLVGWRLVPARRAAAAEDAPTGAYLSELRIEPGSRLIDRPLSEAEAALDRAGALVVGLERRGLRVLAPRSSRRLAEGDILSVEAEVEAIADSVGKLGLALAERDEEGDGREVGLREFVVRPGTVLIGRSAVGLAVRTRYDLTLVALSRQGRRVSGRIRDEALQPGDLLLLHGPLDAMAAFASETEAVALAERDVTLADRGQALTATALLTGAILVAAMGWLPTAVSFTGAVVLSVVLKTVPARSLYAAIDWPVIVLLGALLPVANALESTGTAALLADTVVGTFAAGRPVLALALVIVVTMMLSDVMNNAATAAVMAPIAMGIAEGLGANPDPFLMGVAVGAACAFLTPIGHQNNTLILGPGGFRFSDYWRVGLLLEAVVLAVSIPMLLWAWPL